MLTPCPQAATFPRHIYTAAGSGDSCHQTTARNFFPFSHKRWDSQGCAVPRPEPRSCKNNSLSSHNTNDFACPTLAATKARADFVPLLLSKLGPQSTQPSAAALPDLSTPYSQALQSQAA